MWCGVNKMCEFRDNLLVRFASHLCVLNVGCDMLLLLDHCTCACWNPPCNPIIHPMMTLLEVTGTADTSNQPPSEQRHSISINFVRLADSGHGTKSPRDTLGQLLALLQRSELRACRTSLLRPQILTTGSIALVP